MLEKIVISDRAITAILEETYQRIETETGGVFLGHRNMGIWYVIEMIDPGPNAVFRSDYFEYDQAYVNHLINKISLLYIEPLNLIGLWHRHPSSVDEFSSTDDQTNRKYAQLDAEGSISALVNIDPDFRLTIYEVKEPLSYRKVDYIIGDENIPKHLLEYTSQQSIKRKIKDSTVLIDSKTKGIKRNPIPQYHQPDGREEILSEELCLTRKGSSVGIELGTAIHEYLEIRRSSIVAEGEVTKAEKLSEDKIEEILEALSDDIEYLQSIGIDCEMSINETGYLEMKEILHGGSEYNFPIRLLFGKSENLVVLRYNDYTYRYHSCMLKESFDGMSKLLGYLD